MNLQFSPSSPNDRFVNLRHAHDCLQAVGPLATVTVEAGSKILLSIGDLDILYSSGALVAANHLSGTVEQFDVADKEPRCAIELTPGSFTLFFDDRNVSYSIDDNIVEKCDSPAIPAFSVIASPLSTVSSRIPAVSLSRKYSASETRLDPTDIERVSSAFLASVANATTSAWPQSRFVSPVVTRCRVVDENGQTVFVGPPQLINPLTEVDILPVAVWSVGTDFNSLPTNSVDIDSFGLQFKTIAGTASPRLSVIVEVINRMSLIDFDNLATCLLSRNSSGNTSLTVTSPSLTATGETWRAVAAMLSSADELFVPWYEIPIYRAEVEGDADAFYESFDEYERMLWGLGCSLEQISWYRRKLKEYPDRAMMQAEYPTTAVEAFANSDANVFSAEKIEKLRPGCRQPTAVGEVMGDAASGKYALNNIRFVDDPKGRLKVWQMPDDKSRSITDRYVVTVDIGGRSRSSDYSVIAVLDRAPMMVGERPEIVAQWRGHDDHDIIAWKSASIARWYHNALLVVESNTLETDNIGGDPSLLILNDISRHYRNLYTRQTFDGVTRSVKYGFHTNRATKTLAVSRLIALVRETGYVERDSDALDEMMVFRKIGGGFGAADGYHDDIVMTRAIGLLIVTDMPQPTADDLSYFSSIQF